MHRFDDERSRESRGTEKTFPKLRKILELGRVYTAGDESQSRIHFILFGEREFHVRFSCFEPKMLYSTPETRASLILRLQNADDVAAWETFESIYSPVIQRVAIRHGLQPSDADNVVQEVLLRVAKSVGRWLERADKGPFRAWLRRIAHNEAARLLMRPATRPIGYGANSEDPPLEDYAASDELVSQLDIEYQREVFLWAAEQVRGMVAEPTWLAFWLTHIDGLTIDEAARQLGVNAGTIYFGRSRVMKRLKLAVQQFEEQ